MGDGYVPRSAVAIAPRPDVGITASANLALEVFLVGNTASCGFFVGSRTNPRRRFLLRYAYDHCSGGNIKLG